MVSTRNYRDTRNSTLAFLSVPSPPHGPLFVSLVTAFRHDDSPARGVYTTRCTLYTVEFTPRAVSFGRSDVPVKRGRVRIVFDATGSTKGGGVSEILPWPTTKIYVFFPSNLFDTRPFHASRVFHRWRFLFITGRPAHRCRMELKSFKTRTETYRFFFFNVPPVNPVKISF